eukprot:scaffold17173_cov51-Phaeocystis_antarctica.AAC.1
MGRRRCRDNIYKETPCNSQKNGTRVNGTAARVSHRLQHRACCGLMKIHCALGPPYSYTLVEQRTRGSDCACESNGGDSDGQGRPQGGGGVRSTPPPLRPAQRKLSGV